MFFCLAPQSNAVLPNCILNEDNRQSKKKGITNGSAISGDGSWLLPV